MNRTLSGNSLATTTEKQLKKKNTLYLVLGSIFLTNALIAEMVGPKIFSLEALLGTAPAQIALLGEFTLDFNLTAGVVIWPIVFITTDVINEYFGKKGVRQISFLTAALIAYVFIVLGAVTDLPPAQFWLDINNTDNAGNPFNINEAFNKTFLQSQRIIIGSLFAFLIGQFTDVITFQWLRRFTQSKKIWLRATGSTLISQLIDSFVVLYIAFHAFDGPWSFKQVIAVGIINYIYKFIIAIISTPLIYLAHYLIDLYLGKEFARQLAEDAADSKLFGK
ncbi:queuosine precursor transporter [Algivirga pacifica]|uniref:Probable queuosine precursor transporter n=1 Tax=Algivirga pacifica TaxID=1162670 RepID=A0ABP9DBX6_9BACT